MNKLIAVIILCLCAAPVLAFDDQTIYITDGNGDYAGQILPGGYISDRNGGYVGQIREEGDSIAITDKYGNDQIRMTSDD